MADLKDEDDVWVYVLRDGEEGVIVIGDCSRNAGAIFHLVGCLRAASYETGIACAVIVGQAVGV